jgi:hypothetical protein
MAYLMSYFPRTNEVKARPPAWRHWHLPWTNAFGYKRREAVAIMRHEGQDQLADQSDATIISLLVRCDIDHSDPRDWGYQTFEGCTPPGASMAEAIIAGR